MATRAALSKWGSIQPVHDILDSPADTAAVSGDLHRHGGNYRPASTARHGRSSRGQSANWSRGNHPSAQSRPGGGASRGAGNSVSKGGGRGRSSATAGQAYGGRPLPAPSRRPAAESVQTPSNAAPVSESAHHSAVSGGTIQPPNDAFASLTSSYSTRQYPDYGQPLAHGDDDGMYNYDDYCSPAHFSHQRNSNEASGLSSFTQRSYDSRQRHQTGYIDDSQEIPPWQPYSSQGTAYMDDVWPPLGAGSDNSRHLPLRPGSMGQSTARHHGDYREFTNQEEYRHAESSFHQQQASGRRGDRFSRSRGTPPVFVNLPARSYRDVQPSRSTCAERDDRYDDEGDLIFAANVYHRERTNDRMRDVVSEDLALGGWDAPPPPVRNHHSPPNTPPRELGANYPDALAPEYCTLAAYEPDWDDHNDDACLITVADHSMPAQFRGKLLLRMNIDGYDINVHEGDRAFDLAEEFCQRLALPGKVTRALAARIESETQRVLHERFL